MQSPLITSLRLTNFRNITHLKLDVPQRITLISGENGLGKTNILDALSRINTHRGLKNQHSKECINIAQPHSGWGVGLTFDNGDILQYGRNVNTNKLLYNFNHAPISHEALRSQIPLLWLSPVGEKLFTEEHQEIRTYIDDLIDMVFSSFNEFKTAYDKALKQRLKLLQTNQDPSWITILECEIAKNATQIMRLRQSFIELFNIAYEKIIPDTKEGFPEFSFDISCDTQGFNDVEQYQNKLKSMRYQDQQANRSLFGIHRSRIQVHHKTKNIHIYYCSTGEQKAILTHILWVMNHILQTEHHKTPIMLFDDAMAHYDDRRIQFFYDYMQACPNQFFLTNTVFSKDISSHQNISLIDLSTYMKTQEEIFI